MVTQRSTEKAQRATEEKLCETLCVLCVTLCDKEILCSLNYPFRTSGKNPSSG